MMSLSWCSISLFEQT